MAVARMEKLSLTFQMEYLDEVLQLMQGFQGIHIETGFESTIPPGKKAELDKEIREIEKSIQEIQGAYSVLIGRESVKMRSMLKRSEETTLSVSDLTKIVEESDWEKIMDEVILTDRELQNNRTRRHELTSLFDELTLWEPLACNPLHFKELHRTTALYGSVHKKHVDDFTEHILELEEEGVVFERITESEDRAYFLVIYHNSMELQMNALMSESSFSVEAYPFDKPQRSVRMELEREEAQLVEEEKGIDRRIVEQSKYNEILEFAEDYNLNNLLRKKKSLEVTYDGEAILINGWILANKCELFKKLLATNMPDEAYQLSLSSVQDQDIDRVPIKLENNELFTTYERLTEMYSLPKYNEIDPTPVMTISYMIFFGMMVADVGYGLAVFLVGLVVRKFLKVKRSTRSFVDFLFYLSFPMIGWGLVYGSFCGLPLPFGLISVTVDIIPMTIIALVLGYLHIMVGLVLQMINQIRFEQYFDMMTGGLAWFLTFFGGGLMVLARATPWFEIDVLFWIGSVILGVGLAMTILVPAIQYGRRWYLGIGKGLYALYGATSYLGDFVSYSRLMALGVAGGSVALAFNTILAYLPLPARLSLGLVLAVLLHGLNLFLSMLSAYVHGIRLEFIEFFGKFYTGGGRKFDPFKAAEKNVIINEKEW